MAAAVAAALGGPVGPVAAQEPPPEKPFEQQFVDQQIEHLRTLEAAGQLDDAGRARLEQYTLALTALVEGETWARQRADWERAIAEIPALTEAVETALAQPGPEPVLQPPPDAGLAELRRGLEQAQADLEAARARVDELQDDATKREARRGEIPESIAAARTSLEEVEEQLAAAPPPEEPQALIQARRARLAAQRWALGEQIAALEAERRNYDARAELLPKRQRRWLERARRLEKLVAAWQELVGRAEATEIKAQRRQATRDAARAHPLVAPIAQANVELVRRRDQLRPELEESRERLAELDPDAEELERRLQRLRDRTEAVGLTATVGLLLRKSRAELTDLRVRRRAIAQRQKKMASIEFERLEIEDRFEELTGTIERRVRETLDRLGPTVGPDEREAIEREATVQLETQQALLADLETDLGAYFETLADLNEQDQKVVALTQRIADFIDERILWIRSAAPLSAGDAGRAAAAAAWLTSPRRWATVGGALWRDLRSRWLELGAAAAVLIALVGVRSRERRALRRIADRLSRPTGDTFGRTIQAACVTAARAAAWPAVLWALGRWLTAVAPAADTDLAHAAGAGLVGAASLFLLIEVVRQTCLPKGLGEAHFRWRPRHLRLLRRHLVWLTAVALPAVFVIATLEEQPNEAHVGSLGRAAFVVAMLALAAFLQRVLRPGGGVLREYLAQHRDGWVDRLRYVWFPATVLVPIALAGLSATGYHFTALKLSGQLLESIGLVLAVIFLYGLLLRWLAVAQRRLALAEARRRRAAAEEHAAAPLAEGGPVPEAAPLDVAAVSAQTRQILHSLVVFVLLLGFWLIWADTFPAIGLLREVELWAKGGAGTDGAEAAVAYVTLADLLLALLVLMVTVVVSKNIPGLLEITVLQRLPLEPGGQYAITTILRYAISIAGVVAAFAILGWTWSRLQWIAAAITVGLGFGLQEIFANFVSGIIILFERPIRVGDTVTVGEVSGTITRIRMRATLVRDWNRKELIIPNKEFVTGRIINWTLTDPVLRLVIPVGVAYGSDTALAERLLLQAAREHPVVLADPPPSVIFQAFGDSALQLELRVFIPNIDYLLTTRHELHNAVDRLFREAGVEIAFPQRDIHVRSVRADLPVSMRAVDAASAPEEPGQP